MKPCSNRQKPLTLLAINALESRQAEELRAHVKSCPGCRGYLEEISNVAGKLQMSAAEVSEMEASQSFHRRLAQRIEAEARPGGVAALWAFLRSGGLSWRVTAGVAAGVLVVTIALWPRTGLHNAPRKVEQIASIAKTERSPDPTFGSYRMLVNRSLDALDRELTTEAEGGSPGAPVYTALSVERAIAAN